MGKCWHTVCEGIESQVEARNQGRDVATEMARRITPPEKKMLPCLKCGKIILTDKYHRFCKRCRNANLRDGSGREAMRVASGSMFDDGGTDAEW